tara:strand:- start:70196 stop:71554 length:1359 start_codon:yes stop_codon:yes gene_type:complete
MGNKKMLGTVILSILSLLLFIWGSKRQASLVNTDFNLTDQFAYMQYARELAKSDFTFVGGRNRMPVYPALMSFFYCEGMSDKEFFEKGKWVGIALGIVVIASAFLIFCLGGHTDDALTATLVAMFTVFVFKAPYFQAEVLYYGIGLVLFCVLLNLVHRPSLKMALLAGCLGGIAHLTKASVLPTILLAATCLIVKAVNGLFRQRTESQENKETVYSSIVLPSCCLTLLLFGFLIVVYPYIQTSKEQFGSYFYNVNSTFYMWYDSWQEAKEGTRAHGDRFGWPNMPEEEIPSLGRYLQTHSIADITKRLTLGFATVSGISLVLSFGAGPILLYYLSVVVGFFHQNRHAPELRRMWKERCHTIVFIAAYFIGYIILYAWYTPIASGNRFNHSLFLPAMLICLQSFSLFRRYGMSICLFGKIANPTAINKTILLLLGTYLLIGFPWLVSTVYGGW